MPEINLSIKIIGGKKTDTQVFVSSKSLRRGDIEFKNGARCTYLHLEKLVENYILSQINNLFTDGAHSNRKEAGCLPKN